MSLPEKEILNRVDLSSRRNDINDGMVLTDDGRAFQARVAAAGKARSPSVDRRVGGNNKCGRSTRSEASSSVNMSGRLDCVGEVRHLIT